MISSLKGRARAGEKPAVRDPAARFAHDLAIQPPTKGVASVKAASDVYEANRKSAEQGNRTPPAKRDA